MSILAIAGLAASAAGAIGNAYSNSKASAARRAQERALAQKAAEDKAWFMSEYYKPQMERSENAYAINQAQKFFNDKQLQDQKTAAVTGATNAAVNANKATYANAYGGLTAQIAAGASAQKDRIQQQYDAKREGTFNAQQGLAEQQQLAYQNMAQNWGNLAKAGISSYASSGGFDTDAKGFWNKFLDKPLAMPAAPSTLTPNVGKLGDYNYTNYNNNNLA